MKEKVREAKKANREVLHHEFGVCLRACLGTLIPSFGIRIEFGGTLVQIRKLGIRVPNRNLVFFWNCRL